MFKGQSANISIGNNLQRSGPVTVEFSCETLPLKRGGDNILLSVCLAHILLPHTNNFDKNTNPEKCDWKTPLESQQPPGKQGQAVATQGLLIL